MATTITLPSIEKSWRRIAAANNWTVKVLNDAIWIYNAHGTLIRTEYLSESTEDNGQRQENASSL